MTRSRLVGRHLRGQRGVPVLTGGVVTTASTNVGTPAGGQLEPAGARPVGADGDDLRAVRRVAGRASNAFRFEPPPDTSTTRRAPPAAPGPVTFGDHSGVSQDTEQPPAGRR